MSRFKASSLISAPATIKKRKVTGILKTHVWETGVCMGLSEIKDAWIPMCRIFSLSHFQGPNKVPQIFRTAHVLTTSRGGDLHCVRDAVIRGVCTQGLFRIMDVPQLGGSWVVISRVRSPLMGYSYTPTCKYPWTSKRMLIRSSSDHFRVWGLLGFRV